MEMSIDRTVEISIVHEDKVIVKDEGRGMEIGKGDMTSDLLEDSMMVGNQRFTDSVERIWEV